MKSIYI